MEHALTEEEDKGSRLLNPLQHAILGEVGGPVVVPRLEAHPLELEVDGVGLVAAGGLAMAECDQREKKKQMREQW